MAETMDPLTCPCVVAEMPKCDAGDSCWHFARGVTGFACGHCGQGEERKRRVRAVPRSKRDPALVYCEDAPSCKGHRIAALPHAEAPPTPELQELLDQIGIDGWQPSDLITAAHALGTKDAQRLYELLEVQRDINAKHSSALRVLAAELRAVTVHVRKIPGSQTEQDVLLKADVDAIADTLDTLAERPS